jgi:hypothetical protein
MTAYRCYFFGPDRQMLGRHDFHAGDDAEAVAITKMLTRQFGARGFELWEGLRHVHQEVLP